VTRNQGVTGVNSHSAAARIPFHDPENAKQILLRIKQQVSPALQSAIPALLGDSPDPDAALLGFERLISEPTGEVVRLLNRHNFLAHYAIVVFGHSRFLGETLIQNTDLLQTFLRERNLDRSLSREEFHESLARFRSRSFENDASLLLARFKRREYVRIMLRDVLKLAPLAETTAEISALADVLIEAALRDAQNLLQRRYEAPQHLDSEGRLVDTPFAILSLGKLGGNELNYSSDVDLMYIFGDGEEPSGAAVSNREYFIRLAQQVTEILSRVTREGPVFRIDMRLRPQGGEGELAISLSHALNYYAHGAHDWERQALIKVRHSAGDETLAREFIRGVQRHIYGGGAERADQLNFEAIATSLASREKMHTRRRRSGLHDGDESIDVKVDRGGIRDIEFLVQCLQRVYGGGEPWLRSGGTLFSLQKLHDKRHISGKEFHDLTSAYEFLRHLEHRLQLRQGQQTHRLPASEPDLQFLQKALEGYASGEDRIADVTAAVRRRMSSVAEIYNRIIHHQQSRRRYELPEAQFELRSTPEPAAVEQSHQQMLERLAGDSPEIFQIASRRDLDGQTRRNLFRFLSSAFTSSERYAAVVRQPQALEKALAVFAGSDYLTEILVRHPEEIATLAQLPEPPARVTGGYLFESSFHDVRPTSDPVFDYVAHSSVSYGEKLALLRQHYRHRVFAAGARDITELRDVYQTLGETTAAAEDAVTAALAIAGSPPQLAVLALGRLGTGEFDVLSDADVLFVVDEATDAPALTKSVEQMMQALAAYTRDGSVFPVDTRLRPRGGEGELLSTPMQLEAYFEQEAQPWEALMYTKLRFLAGSKPVADRAQAATQKLFKRFAADPGFLAAIREMRAKLENAEAGEKNFKSSAGAMYDIDFLTSYLLIRHGIADKRGTVRERLWRCAGAGLLQTSDAAPLDHAAELFRTVEHLVRLVVGRARKWLPATEHGRQVTEALARQILQRQFAEGLEEELMRVCREVRGIYERILT
jgi:[glutamine synthetase] adenylyltransferase / [glutamine synthetase]-adenylyl-L-tyrosine phosphorylase